MNRHLQGKLERAARSRNQAEVIELGHDRRGTGAGVAGKPATPIGEHLVGDGEIPLGALRAVGVVGLNTQVDGLVADRQLRVGEGLGCTNRLHKVRHALALESYLGSFGCRLVELRRGRDRGTAAHGGEVRIAITLRRDHVENGARKSQLSSQCLEVKSIHQGEVLIAIPSSGVRLVADVCHEVRDVVQVEMRSRATRAATSVHDAQLDREG
eukprot:3187653-Prymnesium_polylepis.1